MHIVFFIRILNDFDHALPLIDYISKGDDTVEVYTIGDGYKRCKNHLDYLNNVLKIKERPFDQIYYKNFEKVLLNITSKFVRYRLGKNKVFNILLSIVSINIQRLLHTFLNRRINDFTDALPDDTAILIDFGTEGAFPYKNLIRKCNRRHIPIIAYLHGFSIFTNLDPVKIPKTKLPYQINIKLNQIIYGKELCVYYDKYLVGPEQINTYFKSTLYPNFYAHDRIVEIGIPRFTEEWIEKFVNRYNFSYLNENILPDNNRTNVALFLSSSQFDVDIKILNNLIQSLCNESSINFIIKPHTRSELSGADVACSNKVLSECDSSTLIEWADIGILYGSSIAFEMLSKGVEVVIPEYIHGNKTIFESYNVCFIAKSTNNLIDFIRKYKSNRGKYKSNEHNRHDFLNKYVYGGFDSFEELLNEYYFHIKKSTEYYIKK